MLQYDYTNQAWVRDGKYLPCNHDLMFPCMCFGRAHAGEAVKNSPEIHPTLQEMRDHAKRR